MVTASFCQVNTFSAWLVYHGGLTLRLKEASMQFFANKSRKVIREYRLEDIATIWLESQEPVPNGETEHKDNPIEPNIFYTAIEWLIEETTDFWRQEILPNSHIISLRPGFKELIELALRELERADVSSIDPQDIETPTEYKILDSSLREHSIAVARRTISILRNRKDFENYISEGLLAGLVHDIGKLHRKIAGGNHSVNGAHWLQQVSDGMENTHKVLEAVRWHHKPSKAKQSDNPVLAALIAADREVRHEELETYNQMHRKTLPKTGENKPKLPGEQHKELGKNSITNPMKSSQHPSNAVNIKHSELIARLYNVV